MSNFASSFAMDSCGGALGEFQISDTASMTEIEQWLERLASSLSESGQVQPERQSTVAVVSPGAAGVAVVLGSALPEKENWSDPTWVRALYELPSRGVELAAFQAWAREVAAKEIKSISPEGALDDPAGSGFIVKQHVKGCCKASFESEEVCGGPTNLETVVNVGSDVCRLRKQDEEETTVKAAAVTLPQDAPKTWRVTSIRALARKQKQARS